MEWLGGRCWGTRMFPGVSRPDVEKVLNDAEEVGDIVRPFSSENDRHWIEGVGILVGVFGRARGDASFVIAGIFGCERDGGRTRGGGPYPAREDERTREGVELGEFYSESVTRPDYVRSRSPTDLT